MDSAGLVFRSRRGWYNSPEQYGLVAQAVHWTMAVLILAAVVLGVYSGSLERDDPSREPVLTVHKSIGLLVLGLAILRFAWNRYSATPGLSDSLQTWEKWLALAAHKALYILMFAMPITGFLISQSAGREVSFFGLFTVPQIVPIPNVPPSERPLVIINAILHKGVLEFSLYAVVALHVAGVFKHHFIDGRRDMILRMWGIRRS